MAAIETNRQYHSALRTARALSNEADTCRTAARALRKDAENPRDWDEYCELQDKIKEHMKNFHSLMSSARSYRAQAAAYQRRHVAEHGFRVPPARF